MTPEHLDRTNPHRAKWMMDCCEACNGTGKAKQEGEGDSNGQGSD